MRPTLPLHQRIKVGRSHAEPVGVGPAEMIGGVLLESRKGVCEAGKVAFIDVDGNVGGMRRTWEDCLESGYVQRCVDDGRSGIP